VAREGKSGAAEGGAVERRLREVAVLLLLPVVGYLFLSLWSYHSGDPGWSRSGSEGDVRNWGGIFGAWLADLTFYLFGLTAYLIPLILLAAGWRIARGGGAGSMGSLEAPLRLIGVTLLVAACTALAHQHLSSPLSVLPGNAGGVVGTMLGQLLVEVFGHVGASLLLVAILLGSVTLATGLSWFRLMDAIGRGVIRTGQAGMQAWRAFRDWRAAREVRAERAEAVREVVVKRAKREPVRIETPVSEPVRSERATREVQIPLFQSLPSGELPPLSLLDEPKSQVEPYSEETLKGLSRLVELKLKDFRIEARVVEVHPGPVITRFELEPAPGVRGGQVSSLDKDIARGLSVKSVRVVDVIPGKSTIGLEIPNAQRETVFLSEILRSERYDRAASPLSLALGKDIAGRPVVVDLAKMPHLLVAGTTGSGKSVAVNAMVLSILYKATARDVRLIMIDPKMLELSVYEGIPHLLAPVVTDMKDAANALRWCVAEMERRYKLMAAVGVRNLAGFNKKVEDAEAAGQPLLDPLFRPNPDDPARVAEPLTRLPYLVVMIDEFADMMMIVGKKVEELIARLAQKARAAGIHLILATQRPSVDVITGLIKANIPTRIAFQVSSKIDSRTILDQSGAETLLGQGDMLYLPPGTAMPERVHGAFVSDEEVHRVVQHLKSQGRPDYVPGVLEDVQMLDAATQIGPTGLPESAGAGSEEERLYDQAVRIVTESRRASISSVQRHLRIGYNRAARLIEQMEAEGIVSPPERNGERTVIAPPPPRD
jgi:S-DNA-T family DNA segregation ATPase FtsK/SpoIIIE